MVRAFFLFIGISCAVALASATDVRLPDTVRIRPQQKIRIPVAGKLPKLGEVVATIQYTPGVVSISNVEGQASYALTCSAFGLVSASQTRSESVVEASCGSGGAGVHDTLFAIEIEGVYSSDTLGTLRIAGLKLDGVPLEVTSNECTVIREGGLLGGLTTPTNITGNYPNPFSTSTTLSYSVTSQQSVTINVRTIQGRMVRSFTDVAAMPGENEFTMNFLQSDIGSGRYLVELITKEATVYHTIAVMR